MSTLPDYQQAQLLLEKNEIFVAPSEAHGVISGLLACGINIEADEYLGLLSDVFNDGQAFSKDLKAFLLMCILRLLPVLVMKNFSLTYFYQAMMKH